MVVYSELPVQDFPTSQLPAQELPAHNYFVPIPPSYERHPSFPLQKGLEFEPRNSDESNQFKVIETTEAMWKLKMKRNIGLLFRFLLFNSKEYTRILAILVMTASFLLVVTPLIIYAKAQKKPNDFDTFPKISPITTKPCILFAGVATMNFLISVLLLAFSLLSSKFSKSISFMNAMFTIVAAIGFCSSIGACLYLNKGSPNKVDLWKWSCNNAKLGFKSYALDFHFVCKILTLSWDFGLLQAALELYTVLISATAFVIVKYEHFSRYGRVGKIF